MMLEIPRNGKYKKYESVNGSIMKARQKLPPFCCEIRTKINSTSYLIYQERMK